MPGKIRAENESLYLKKMHIMFVRVIVVVVIVVVVVVVVVLELFTRFASETRKAATSPT